MLSRRECTPRWSISRLDVDCWLISAQNLRREGSSSSPAEAWEKERLGTSHSSEQGAGQAGEETAIERHQRDLELQHVLEACMSCCSSISSAASISL